MEALMCLIALAAYLRGTFMNQDPVNDQEDGYQKSMPSLKDIAALVLSSVFVYLGARFTVDSVIKISEILAIGSEVIALSAVALGTSLPEVMVSVSAARKGKSDMIIGNIIGSNIFNTFGVMGACGLSGDLIIPPSIGEFSLPLSVAAAFMYFVITKDQKINRSEGTILLIFYAFFIGRLFEWI
jgi:cation:H+ antiporter